MIRFTQKFTLVFAIALTAFSCSTLPEDPRTWEGLYPQKKSNVKNSSFDNFIPGNQSDQEFSIHTLNPGDRDLKITTDAK